MLDYKQDLLTDNSDDGSWLASLVSVWNAVVVVGVDIEYSRVNWRQHG